MKKLIILFSLLAPALSLGAWEYHDKALCADYLDNVKSHEIIWAWSHGFFVGMNEGREDDINIIRMQKTLYSVCEQMPGVTIRDAAKAAYSVEFIK